MVLEERTLGEKFTFIVFILTVFLQFSQRLVVTCVRLRRKQLALSLRLNFFGVASHQLGVVFSVDVDAQSDVASQEVVGLPLDCVALMFHT